MISDIINKVKDTISLIRENPKKAAQNFRAVAAKYLEIANKLDTLSNEKTESLGGTSDRVKLNVVRNGEIIQSVDTGE